MKRWINATQTCIAPYIDNVPIIVHQWNGIHSTASNNVTWAITRRWADYGSHTSTAHISIWKINNCLLPLKLSRRRRLLVCLRGNLAPSSTCVIIVKRTLHLSTSDIKFAFFSFPSAIIFSILSQEKLLNATRMQINYSFLFCYTDVK